jgi:ribonuclease P/MRP protein subunit RPP40
MVLFNRLNFQIKNIITSSTDVIYLDFSKAFDKMDHGVILSKLDPIGFTPHLIQFFKSYLEGRRQYVDCNGQYSKNIYMTSGVPQGSVCGPLLFNLFINDVVDDLSYDDDIKIFTKINSLIDCVRLQNNLDKICNVVV